MSGSSNEKNELSFLNAKQFLKENETKYKLLIEGVRDYAIFMLNPKGYIFTWNLGAEKLKGYTEEEIINKHFSIFYTEDALETNYPAYELKRAKKDGRFEDEGWRVRKDGSRFWANVIITPIYDANNQHIGFTKITRDLSERIRNEELMRKNAELHRLNTDLDNFVYTASHDLKSPITNMEGLLSLIENKIGPKLDDSEKQIIQMMEICVRKLNNTIAGLVEVTKAQKNLEEKVEIVSFKELLDDVKAEMATIVAQSNAEIIEDITVKALTFPKGSLRSIIYNLLSNAIKYRSPDRLPEIKISTYHEGDKIVLSIKDNGLGLTKSQQAKLFHMFKRFHSHVEGTGIGLYIVKRTLENNKGKIKVNSKLNEGTEFKLYFNT